MGPGIDRLVTTIEQYFTGGPPAANDLDFSDTTFDVFANPYGPPPFGLDDENNLSLVVFVTCGNNRFVFPGDLEKAGWRAMLKKPEFIRMLNGVTFFVASHHGRENGYCEEVLAHCPQIETVIISDQAKQYQTQETIPLYRKHACGINFGGKMRHVLTTRRDGGMQFDMYPIGGRVNLQRTGT